MNKTILLSFSALLIGCACAPSQALGGDLPHSDIKIDEHVVFFRSTAWLDDDTQEWRVPIHGWIYEPQDSSARKAMFSTILSEKYGLAADAKTEANFTRRINLMLADNERGKQIVVSVAGRNYRLPASAPNGHFETTLNIPGADVEKFADGDLIRFSAVTSARETRTFSGEVRLVKRTGLSIISDIDDTVKISNVTDRKSLLEHTFLLDFAAAPGMAELYSEWSRHDVSLHFVSSSPWQLYAPLQEFLDENDFPWATFSLKAVRFRDETLFDLFKKGTETKPVAIEKILNAYAERKFVLIGDSGEQDPEVYAALLRKHPDKILKVYIRNVTLESADNERFTSVFACTDSNRWRLFDDPATLTLPEFP
ncbi:MAG: DUF2183 domain-containing protein [Gammaproteobacteria bacterium]|nr:DUF2183 domain-containing protein [Gammaproteobacteria bacterium]